MRFEQTAKHRRGGYGSMTLFPSDEVGQRALERSVEIKPGLRAVRDSQGRLAIFRSMSKKPGTFGYDSWHGGWEANSNEVGEIGGTHVPTFDG